MIRLQNRYSAFPAGLLIVMGTLTIVPAVRAQVVADTLTQSPATSSRGLLRGYRPAILIGATFLFDEGMRDLVQDGRSNTTNSFARIGNGFGDYRFFVPAIAAGFIAGQVLHRPAISKASVESAQAAAAVGVLVTVVKTVSGRPRPWQATQDDDLRPFSGYASFPSGHTAVAFAFASTLAHRIHNPWVKGALYSGASLTAFARLNDDKHWLSDVVVGAVVGEVAGRLVTRLGRRRAQVAAAPAPTLGLER